MLPSPTALPAAARTKPIEPLKEFRVFFMSFTCSFNYYLVDLSYYFRQSAYVNVVAYYPEDVANFEFVGG